MFVFKKIVGSLLMPLPFWLLISFLGLFLLWRGKRVFAAKILITLGLTGLTVMSYNSVSRILNRPLNCRYEAYRPDFSLKTAKTSKQAVKYVVVLAGGHKSDPHIPVTGQLGGETLIRLVEGIRVLRQFPRAKLILSGGGTVDPVPVATVMAQAARLMGVERDKLIIENTSNDTKDQARLIRPIVGDSPFLLVTSAIHLPRAMALFEKLGMHPVPAPAGSTSRVKMPFSLHDIFPSVDALEDSTEAVHEYLGILWGRLKGQI